MSSVRTSVSRGEAPEAPPNRSDEPGNQPHHGWDAGEGVGDFPTPNPSATRGGGRPPRVRAEVLGKKEPPWGAPPATHARGPRLLQRLRATALLMAVAAGLVLTQ